MKCSSMPQRIRQMRNGALQESRYPPYPIKQSHDLSDEFVALMYQVFESQSSSIVKDTVEAAIIES